MPTLWYILGWGGVLGVNNIMSLQLTKLGSAKLFSIFNQYMKQIVLHIQKDHVNLGSACFMINVQTDASINTMLSYPRLV